MCIAPPEYTWEAQRIDAANGGHLFQSFHGHCDRDPLGGGGQIRPNCFCHSNGVPPFFRVTCTDAIQAAMPLNTSHYLTKQGWKGHGTPLDGEQGRGLRKPLIIPQKRNLGGIGQNRDRAVEWWDDIFAVGTCYAY